jgi:hypothetical protein
MPKGAPAQPIGQLQPHNVVGIGLDVDQDFGEPASVSARPEPVDQSGALGFGALDHVKQLACGRFEGGNDASTNETSIHESQ